MPSNRFSSAFCVVLMLCAPAATSQASKLSEQPRAQKLTADNIAQLQPSGPDAIGGIGDWLLSNGKMCAVVSDAAHDSGFMVGGGALVDVYDCKVGNDQWAFQHFLPNVDQHSVLATQSISVINTQSTASILVTATGSGLTLESVYAMDSENLTQLQVRHTLKRNGDSDALTMLGLLILHPHTSLTPFSISTRYPEYALGFRYPASSTEDMSSLIDAMVPADVHVLVGALNLGAVSYGVHMNRAELFSEAGDASPLPVFQQTGESYNIQGTLSRSPWLGGNGKLGFLEFAQSQLMDLDVGERIELDQTIYLGDRADVASVSNQIYKGPTLSGTIDSATAVVDVFSGKGHPITSVRPNAHGELRAVLPIGTTEVRVVVSDTTTRQTQNHEFSFDGGALDIGQLTAAKPAELKIDNDMALRLTFVGIDGTPDPNFYDNGFNANFGDARDPNIQAANYLNFAGTQSDQRAVNLPPGRYRVLASRGMEFGVTEQVLDLSSGPNPALIVQAPQRELNTSGLLAADFHVHSAPSFDSYIGIDERLRGFVAQGGDVLVATEHNVLVDYQEDLVAAGLQGVVSILSGIELTGMARTSTVPNTHGHLNVFPMQARPQQFAGGLPAHEGFRLREIYANLADEKSGRLFQLNHPRSIDPESTDQDSNYFDHLNVGQSYNPQLALSAAEHKSLIDKDPETGFRDLDFDVLEVANGPYFNNYQRVLSDWFSLLNQGERIVATANSDTHGNNYLVAIPQSYVQIDKYSQAKFMAAVKQGKMFGTSGPLLDLEMVGASTSAGMGEMASGASQTLKVAVRAASWVPVDTLSVFVNGQLEKEQAISRGSSTEVELSFAKDSFVVVEVSGAASGVYELLAPDFVPFAFSNPIYVDADEDGQWTAPGIP